MVTIRRYELTDAQWLVTHVAIEKSCDFAYNIGITIFTKGATHYAKEKNQANIHFQERRAVQNVICETPRPTTTISSDLAGDTISHNKTVPLEKY